MRRNTAVEWNVGEKAQISWFLLWICFLIHKNPTALSILVFYPKVIWCERHSNLKKYRVLKDNDRVYYEQRTTKETLKCAKKRKKHANNMCASQQLSIKLPFFISLRVASRVKFSKGNKVYYGHRRRSLRSGKRYRCCQHRPSPFL